MVAACVEMITLLRLRDCHHHAENNKHVVKVQEQSRLKKTKKQKQIMLLYKDVS